MGSALDLGQICPLSRADPILWYLNSCSFVFQDLNKQAFMLIFVLIFYGQYFVLDSKECIHYVRIKVAFSALLDDAKRFFQGKGFFVRPFVVLYCDTFGDLTILAGLCFSSSEFTQNSNSCLITTTLYLQCEIGANT